MCLEFSPDGRSLAAHAKGVLRNQSVIGVSEEDVRRAMAAGGKIYVNAKTIITPSASSRSMTLRTSSSVSGSK